MNTNKYDKKKKSSIRCLTGHAQKITGIVFSPDNLLAVSGSYDKTICLWNLATGDCVKEYNNHSCEIFSIALSPDGRYLVSSGLEPRVHMWDIVLGKYVCMLEEHCVPKAFMCFSPDSSLIFCGDMEGGCSIFLVKNGKKVREFQSDNIVRIGCFSHDGRYILTKNDEGIIDVWNTITGERISTGYTIDLDYTERYEYRQFICHLPARFQHDGKSFTYLEKKSYPVVWEIHRNSKSIYPCSFPFEEPQNCTAIALSSDGKKVLCGYRDGTLLLQKMENGEIISKLIDHTDEIQYVTFSADGRYALSGSADTTIRLWSLEDEIYILCHYGDWYENIRPFLEHFLTFHSNYSQNGLSRRGNPHWTEADVKELMHTLSLAGYCSISLCKVIKELNIYCDTFIAAKRSIEECISRQDWISADFLLTSYQNAPGPFSDNEDLYDLRISIGSCGNIKNFLGIFSFQQISLQRKQVLCGAISSNGQFVVTVDWNHMIQVWDKNTCTCIQNCDGLCTISSVAFSSDNSLIACGLCDNRVLVWDRIKNRKPYVLGEVIKELLWCDVTALYFFGNNQYLLFINSIGIVTKLSVRDRYCYTLLDTQGREGLLALSPDERFFITVDFDNALHIWDITTMERVSIIPDIYGEKMKNNASETEYDKMQYPGGTINYNDVENRYFDARRGIFKTESGTYIKQDFNHRLHVMSVGFLPDGKYIVKGYSNGESWIIEADSWKRVHSLERLTGQVVSSSFSPDGRFLLSGDTNHEILLSEVHTGRTVYRFYNYYVSDYWDDEKNDSNERKHDLVYFSPDGSFFSGCWQDSLRFWNINWEYEF